MRKIIILTMALISVLSVASCQKQIENEGNGYLSLSGLSLAIDESVITRSSAEADGSYLIIIKNEAGTEVYRSSYSDVKSKGNKISLKAGAYNFIARSTHGEIPIAAFYPAAVYGVKKPFTIVAGQKTELGSIVCTLQQCMVNVSYGDDFLATVTGDCTTEVTVMEGETLSYALTYDASAAEGKKCTYDQRYGYFAVEEGTEGSTMTVVFKGNVDGKSQKMTKTFSGVKAKEWRQIKFVKKTNAQGTATFDIVIDALIDDEELSCAVNAKDEAILGSDPYAPIGDGGITMEFAPGSDPQLTDLSNIEIVPLAANGGRDMKILLKATVPNGIKKFSVDITSTSEAFVASVGLVDGHHIDLINPTKLQEGITEIVPFPMGKQLVGKTEVTFELSKAQEPILAFPGTHTFSMTIADAEGYKKTIEVKMVVRQ